MSKWWLVGLLVTMVGIVDGQGPAWQTATGSKAATETVPKFAAATPIVAGPSLASAGDTIGFCREIAGGTQAITLINTSRRWMAVYHIDQAGQIRLLSSRPLDADFSFQFNATAPLPDDIRKIQGG